MVIVIQKLQSSYVLHIIYKYWIKFQFKRYIYLKFYVLLNINLNESNRRFNV